MNDLLRKRSFGQLLRSISLNMNDYSPQSIEISDSKSHFLATTVILGQAPSAANSYPYSGSPAWIFHEDSALRGNLAKQVGQSPEETWSEIRGPPRAEEDGLRCDARFSSGVE